MDENREYINTLLDILIERFSRDELELLAFRILGESELKGHSKHEKATALIETIKHRQCYLELITAGQRQRPDIDWLFPPGLKQAWIENARRMERNQAYSQAIEQWQQLQQFLPHTDDIDQEIQRLQEKKRHTQRVVELKHHLSQHKFSISKIYIEVMTRLKRMEKEELDATAEIILETIEEFLAGDLSAPKFIEFWQQGINQSLSSPLEVPHYQALAGRLRRGEIVIFLGTDVPALFNTRLPSADKLVPQLAQCVHYPEFTGSFPEICEYSDINNQYGRNFIRQQLHTLLQPNPLTSIELYELLAQLDTPLIIISGCMGNGLETAFEHQGKKFALLSHSVEHIGTLLLKCSDQTELKLDASENVSGLSLLEQGYSVIYKILGCFSLNQTLSVNQRDSLMLSEQDYFTFIRHTDKLIPHYLIRQLTHRGFWLLGHYLNSWENRLIVKEILKKRAHGELALSIHKQADNFARVFWENERVKNYNVDLKEFVEHLRVYL